MQRLHIIACDLGFEQRIAGKRKRGAQMSVEMKAKCSGNAR